MHIYGEAEALIADLEAANEPADASAIRQSMHSGSVGTEIMLNLRFELQQIRKRDYVARLNLEDRIGDIIAEIERAIQRGGPFFFRD